MSGSTSNLRKHSFFWKCAEYGIYLFFALFPFINLQTFLYGGTSIRLVSLVLASSILGIVFGISLFKKFSSFSIPKSFIPLSLLVYFVALALSGVVGLSFHTSFWSVVTRMTGIWYFLNYGFFLYVLWGVLQQKAKQNILILTVLFSTTLYSILSFFGPEGVGFLFKGYEADGFTFGNSTFAGMYIFGAFVLSLYYLFQSSKKKWWMYVLPIVLVINPNIINNKIWFGDFSGGIVGEARASAYVILFSLVGLLFMWLISKVKDKKVQSRVMYSLFVVAVVGGAISTHSLLSHDGFLKKAYLAQASAARPLVWEISEKAIRQRPLFGWGTDNFERVFEANYDSRLLQVEYGSEAWFDRAHNLFIDQAVDNGIVGLIFYILIYLVILLSLLYTFLRSTIPHDRLLASVLLVYFPLHFIELQTAFDTTISYPMLGVMIVFSIILFDRTKQMVKNKDQEWVISHQISRYVVGSILIAFFTWSLFWGLLPFVRAQIANGEIRTVGSAEKRIPLYKTLLSSPVDAHAFLWRTSTDFQRGIAENPAVLSDARKVQNFQREVVILEDGYREYIKNNPNDFRPRLNLADILIYQRLFGSDKLQEAQSVLDTVIERAPQSPQPYWMKAVAYIYMKKFDLAREYARKGVALNPKIEQSQAIVAYVEDSIKHFPDIQLVFFTQI